MKLCGENFLLKNQIRQEYVLTRATISAFNFFFFFLLLLFTRNRISKIFVWVSFFVFHKSLVFDSKEWIRPFGNITVKNFDILSPYVVLCCVVCMPSIKFRRQIDDTELRKSLHIWDIIEKRMCFSNNNNFKRHIRYVPCSCFVDFVGWNT